MLRIYRHYVPALVFVMVAADLVVIALALASAQWLGYSNGEGSLWAKSSILTAVTLLALYLADLYQLDFRIRRAELASRLIIAMAVSSVATAAVGFAIPHLGLGRLTFIHTFGVIALGCLGTRLVWLARVAKRKLHHRVLVLGVGPSASVLPELQFSPTRPFTILGFLDDAPDAADRVPAGFELLGKTKDLLSLTDELRPDLVLVALAEMRRALPAEELLECRLQGINVEDWPTFYEKETGQDPRHEPSAQLAHLLGRFRQDRHDAGREARDGCRARLHRSRLRLAAHGGGGVRHQAHLQGPGPVHAAARR